MRSQSMQQEDPRSEPGTEEALPLRHFVAKFRRYPLRDKRMTVAGVLRFLLNARKFESREPIVIGKKVFIGKGWDGRLVAGRGVRIAYGCVILVGHKGSLSLGTRTIIGPNTRIMAATQVRIGARCMISWNCSIFDSIGHRMWLEGQDEMEMEAPITIGDDVWIGPYTVIMKGVNIGNNCVVGAGSVVRRDVPPNTLVYGNPARPAGKVARWER
jgi:acetyltransferase-like isoleucine patch superfamily enzyme